MSTTDLLARWSTLSLDEIADELQDPTNLAQAEQLLGADEVSELQEVSETKAAFGPREAVVLLPGLMGSLLSSIRGINKLLWLNPTLILQGQTDYLALNHDGTGDSHPLIDSVPSGIERIHYLKIAMALRSECLLFEFPYDWRLRIEHNGDLLARYLERWSDGDPDMQFTLVGHSMGGLVSRAYIARHPEAAKRRIRRVIMHGTPHFGAAGAVADLMQGNSLMKISKKINGNNDMQKLVLTLPSAYQLLPAPPDLFPKERAYPVNWDLYDAKAWRMEGVRQEFLDDGRRFHELLADFDHQVEMIEIAGCNEDTVVDVKRTFDEGERPRLEVIRKEEGTDAGDGTVPLWSARLPGTRMYYIQHIHRSLPVNSDVIRATLALIQDRAPDLPTEIPPRKGGWFSFAPATAAPEDEAEQLRTRLESGQATQEDLEKLFFL
jgi:pimeloyl-ACP methyl ester carboxylesterase